jgi:FKBP-type peptidyl-prolyl cis-trans isomerase
MKKFILTLAISALFLAGCSIDGDDNCVTKTVASEQARMEAMANARGMTWSQHSTGILYEIVNAGAGMTASSSSRIFVKYEGRLENGTIFETGTDETQTGWVLGSLILGWQIAIPLIQEGGKIRVVIPSSLAYGCGSRGNIPSNAILYFEIELVDIQ